MAKYNFENSRYARFFSDKTNQRYLQTFLDQQDILKTNYTWYRTQSQKAAQSTPTANDGTATFTVKARSLKAAPLMNLRAPLGLGRQEDENGLAWYSGTIPDFAANNNFVENAAERLDRMKRFEEFGNDADLVADYVEKVQKMVDSIDATLNFMTAQIESTGKIDYSGIGRGIQIPLYKADIPTANFRTAGSVVWTDESFKILSYLMEQEKEYRDERGYNGGLVWQMTRNFFDKVLLKNAEVVDLVKNYRIVNIFDGDKTVLGDDTMPVAESLFRKAVEQIAGLSPIEVVEEKKERNLTSETDSFIKGWDDRYVALRPVGFPVEIEYAEIKEREIPSELRASSVGIQMAQIANGYGTLVNTTLDNGQFKEWHTDAFMKSVPALRDFPYRIIYDTTTAD